MILPEPITVDPLAPDLTEHLALLPCSPGIYSLRLRERPPRLAWTQNLNKRAKRLLLDRHPGQNALASRAWRYLTSFECWPTASRLESLLLLYRLSKRYAPSNYMQQLRLRLPWFLTVLTQDPYPRLTVSNGISARGGLILGPFANRELAQRYEQHVTRLFKIRQCTEPLQPSLDHPGCIFGEINQCLRPCQCVITTQGYASEVHRMSDFLITNGKKTLRTLAAERNRACDASEFERASQLHKSWEAIHEVAGQRDEVIAEARQFGGVALTHGIRPGQLILWPMFEGFWQPPLAFELGEGVAQSSFTTHEVTARLEATLANPHAEGKLVEELALFSRWYYSSSRDGQWHKFGSLDDLNASRLVRAMTNMLKSGSSSR